MKTLCNIIAILLVTSLFPVFACLNGEHLELSDGSMLYTDAQGFTIPSGHRFYEDEMNTALVNLDSLWKQTGEVKYLSDYALVLIIKKRYAEAEKIYLQIEQDFPGRYSTASNIGTLYELIGENQKALHWISKAVEIDPHSHMNSEWLHVNILKAKLKGEEAFTSQFLVGTDFGDYDLPSTGLKENALSDLQFALYYQLNERMSFIQPKDKIIGILLGNLGDVLWLLRNQPHAVEVYTKSLAYAPDIELTQRRLEMASAKPVLLKPGLIYGKTDYSFAIAGVLVFLSIAVFTFMRVRRQ